ncbi:hypothetical protein N9M80_03575, partial [Flavobacteriales bacterium]|nr:hypothetical protein [Flavobacteriales bacterium]
YPFNGNANDESGNGYDGVVQGASLSENRFGIENQSFSFDGMDDFISVSNDFNFNELTVSVWIKQNQFAETYSAIIDRSLTNNIGWWIEDNAVSYDSLLFTGGVASGNYFRTQAARPQPNAWTHIGALYSSGNQQLFINGVLVDQDVNSLMLQFPEVTMFLGKRTNSAFWDGSIDDVALWNRALTEEEILALYNAPAPAPGCTDPTACNYNEEANEDDGSCLLTSELSLQNQIQISSEGELVLTAPETLQNWTWDNGTSDSSIPIGSGGTFSIQGVIGVIPEIGSELNEGLIFDIDSLNQIVYIASPEEIGTGSEWGCYGTSTGASGQGMGDGITNTQLILEHCTDENSAAAVASNYGENWYLPSFEELDAIRTQLHNNGFGDYSMDNPLSFNWYWSSTECSENPDWAAGSMHFSDGFYGACNNKDSNPGGVIAAKIVQGDFCLFTDTITIQLDCSPSNDPSSTESVCGPGTYWDELESLCLPIETCQDDLDGDGVIGVNDLMQLLSSFGTDCTPAEEPETTEFTCGDPVSYHGYDYTTVQIGEQCWFAENLRTEYYANGDAIPANLTDSEWSSTTSGAVSVYGEDAGCVDYSPDGDACDPAWSLNEYGRLYNWYAVDDTRGLCPSMWHAPTDEEWVVMSDFLGGSSVAGYQMKTNYGWHNGGSGSNSIGYAGLASGFRRIIGSFDNAGISGNWWSSSLSVSSAWYRDLDSVDSNLDRGTHSQNFGFSIRCLKD